MKIDSSNIFKHISDLLFLHDFVTIPDFGSFVTNYKSAEISERGLIPPSKSISFNSALKTDDGLLISYLSGIYNTDYNKSKSIISEFVRDIFIDLDANKQVSFENIGYFEFDKKLNLIFEPELKLNFLADSFGLSTIHYPVLEEQASKIERSLKDKSKLKKSLTSKSAKIVYLIIPIIILISVISTNINIFNKNNYNYSNIGDIVSFSDNNQNKSSIERQLDSMTKKENALMYKENIKPLNTDNTFSLNEKKNKKGKEKTIETIELKQEEKKEDKFDKLIAKEKKGTSDKKDIATTKEKKQFILVAGSFSTQKNAERFVKKLKKKDISPEIIKHNGKYRVSAVSFDTKKEAKAEVKKLKKLEIKTWVSTR